MAKIVKLIDIIVMDFQNNKMVLSHVDMAYAAISTVKMPQAFAVISRMRFDEKQSEISGFGLIKWWFRLKYALRFFAFYVYNLTLWAQ